MGKIGIVIGTKFQTGKLISWKQYTKLKDLTLKSFMEEKKWWKDGCPKLFLQPKSSHNFSETKDHSVCMPPFEEERHIVLRM